MKQEHTSVKEPLSCIADVFQGHLFRNGISLKSNGNLFLIRPSDVDDLGRVTNKSPYRISTKDIKNREIISPNDVILKSKTKKPVAVRIVNTDFKYTVTDHFYIIRLNTKRIDPEYLKWFLNSRTARSFFSKRVGGTNVPFLRKPDLLELQIPIPSIEAQNEITNLNTLMNKEKELTTELMQVRNNLVEQVSINIARGE